MNEKNEIEAKVIDELDAIVESENENLESEEISNVKKKIKVKKHNEALRLVAESKQMVQEANEQTKACKLLLNSDLKEYEKAKKSLNLGGLDICAELIEKLGYKTTGNVENIDEVVVFQPKEELESIVLKNVSSGKFTGLMYSLLGGAITSVGLVYLATEKLGMTLDITKIPSLETMGNIMSWHSNLIGIESNVYVGFGIFSVLVVSVMAVIYAIRVNIKGNKNLYFAVKQHVEAELYTEQKGNCKTEMDKVDAHIKETIEVLKMYEVLFNEQKGKLERILHIEGSKGKSSDYHEKSFLEIRETKEMIRTIKDFTSTSMSEEGKLSEKSILFLKRAKMQIDKILERLY